MRILALDELPLAPITAYDSHGATGLEWASGSGDAHVHTLRFAPGGAIGPHPTGFAQILVPIAGAGWVSGSDAVRRPIRVGQAALFERGELHAKGSDTGMVALMVQVSDLSAAAR